MKWLFFALVLISCNKLKEGEVVEKWYEPTHTYLMFMPMSTGKTTIMIPYFVTDYEDWVIKIKGYYKGKEREETVYVSKRQYECLSVNSHFTLDRDCSYEDENNVKKRQ